MVNHDHCSGQPAQGADKSFGGATPYATAVEDEPIIIGDVETLQREREEARLRREQGEMEQDVGSGIVHRPIRGCQRRIPGKCATTGDDAEEIGECRSFSPDDECKCGGGGEWDTAEPVRAPRRTGGNGPRPSGCAEMNGVSRNNFSNQSNRTRRPMSSGGANVSFSQRPQSNQRTIGQQNLSSVGSCSRRLPFGNLREWDRLRSTQCLEGLVNEYFDDVAPLNFNDIYGLNVIQLQELATSLDIGDGVRPGQRKRILQFCLQRTIENHTPIAVDGLLAMLPDGNGYLAHGADNYQVSDFSVFIPRCLIRYFGLRRGQLLSVQAIWANPTPNVQALCAIKLLRVMGKDPHEASSFAQFHDLVPYYPTERILLESAGANAAQNISMRIVDLLVPIGLGQRGLIVAPPRTGKTMLLQAIANAIVANRPEVHLMVLLIDERPEEVTDFRRTAKGDVFASTFDEYADNHLHVAELVIENARRRVECGEHVVILLDSITRLARAYNTVMPSSGRVLTGGIDANALQGPKSFFGSARNIEGGGSLTILGTALVETGSRMDDVIFEEFKGTGNMELHLDRDLAERRIYPAINIGKSGTRKEELLYHPDELARIHMLHRAIHGVTSHEAMDMLIQRIRKTNSNVEFLMSVNR